MSIGAGIGAEPIASGPIGAGSIADARPAPAFDWAGIAATPIASAPIAGAKLADAILLEAICDMEFIMLASAIETIVMQGDLGTIVDATSMQTDIVCH